MNVLDLLALANKMLQDGHTRDEVFSFLAGLTAKNPLLEPAVSAVEAMLKPLLAQGNITDTFTKALSEVLALLKTKYGPVSDAPEIGL